MLTIGYGAVIKVIIPLVFASSMYESYITEDDLASNSYLAKMIPRKLLPLVGIGPKNDVGPYKAETDGVPALVFAWIKVAEFNAALWGPQAFLFLMFMW